MSRTSNFCRWGTIWNSIIWCWIPPEQFFFQGWVSSTANATPIDPLKSTWCRECDWQVYRLWMDGYGWKMLGAKPGKSAVFNKWLPASKLLYMEHPTYMPQSCSGCFRLDVDKCSATSVLGRAGPCCKRRVQLIRQECGIVTFVVYSIYHETFSCVMCGTLFYGKHIYDNFLTWY